MPTYSYRCERCDEEFDIFQSFSATSLKVHEDCGGSLRKIFHPTGVVFKGSGFYVTDSRKGSGAPGPSKGDGAKGGESAKSDGAKGDGAKGDGAKGDGAKGGESAKSDGAKAGGSSTGGSSGKRAAGTGATTD
jgi:putative FmdB family regulatory protein